MGQNARSRLVSVVRKGDLKVNVEDYLELIDGMIQTVRPMHDKLESLLTDASTYDERDAEKYARYLLDALEEILREVEPRAARARYAAAEVDEEMEALNDNRGDHRADNSTR